MHCTKARIYVRFKSSGTSITNKKTGEKSVGVGGFASRDEALPGFGFNAESTTSRLKEISLVTIDVQRHS